MMTKKLTSLALALVMCMTLCVPAFAANLSSANSTSGTFVSQELGGTLTRIIQGSKVIVTWVSDNETGSYTLVSDGENVYLNGTVFDGLDKILKQVPLIERIPMVRQASSNITWGAWQSFRDKVNTGGIATALIAGALATRCPWMPLSILLVSITTISAKTDYIIVSGRIRYGHDSTYRHYERYTSLIADNGSYLLTDFHDSGKERIR